MAPLRRRLCLIQRWGPEIIFIYENLLKNNNTHRNFYKGNLAQAFLSQPWLRNVSLEHTIEQNVVVI